MPVSVQTKADIERLNTPRFLSLPEILALDVDPPRDLIEGILTDASLNMLIGAKKQGKTLFATQTAVAVATGQPFVGAYRIGTSGPAAIIEVDDPRGVASVKDLLAKSSTLKANPKASIYAIDKVPFTFGSEFSDWLRREITEKSCKLVVIDSYTKLRPRRKSGADVVKDEEEDLTPLGEIARDTKAAILLLHHDSKSSSRAHWTDRSAGTYAMGSVPVSQIYISRFDDLEPVAPERLVQLRGRHGDDKELLLRFRKESLDYEFVLEGAGAALYPLVKEIQEHFQRKKFSPKELHLATGVSISTANRQLSRLLRADVLARPFTGEYQLKSPL